MAGNRIKVEAGTGNVFADLGYPDAIERSLRVRLAMEINRVIGKKGLTQAGVAKLLGLHQPHVSDLANYRLNRFSAERLMSFLTTLGKEVEIRISRRTSRLAKSDIRVRLVA